MNFKRHQDNEEFVTAFRNALTNMNDKDLLYLISEGQFNAVGHSCYGVSHNCDECDNCYSGDTACDGVGAFVLGQIWMQVATDLELNTDKFYEPSDAEESEESE